MWVLAVRRLAVVGPGSERIEQGAQAVVVDLVHQRQQAPDLAGRESLAGEPVQVVARQIGDEPAGVLAERHLAFDESLEILGFHAARP